MPDGYHFFKIEKTKPFSAEEHELIENIVENGRSTSAFDSEYRDELSKSIVKVAIAKFVGGGERSEVIKRIIDIYDSWSSQTYEGNRISHNMAVDLEDTKSAKGTRGFLSDLQSHRDEDYLKILGSGYDTILSILPEGKVYNLSVIRRPAQSVLENIDAPVSLAHLAYKSQQGSKAIISLTRNGEILLFKNSELVFAKRRGVWRYFPHELIRRDAMQIEGIDNIQRKIRVAIYRTALDVAFSRGGACLGIIPSVTEVKKCIPAERILADDQNSLSIYRTIIGKRKFFDIPRAIRAELCSIDGSTIVDLEGKVVCAGTILSNSGNKEGGGGRTAAARHISEFGIGIKVSNDGYVELFPNGYNSLPKASRLTTRWA